MYQTDVLLSKKIAFKYLINDGDENYQFRKKRKKQIS